MSIIKEKYTANRVGMLHRMLQNDAEHGKCRDYEIKVDDMKVVMRNNEPERFFQHEDFVQQDTACVTISIFEGASRNCLRYELYMTGVPEEKNTLGNIDEIITEKLETQKKEWKYQLMEKENEELKEQLDEAEEYHEALQQEIEELKTRKPAFAEVLGQVASSALQDIATKNADKIKNIPGLGGLVGLLAPEHPTAISEKEGAVTFEKKSGRKENDSENKTHTPADQEALQIGRFLKTSFTPDQFPVVMDLIKKLSLHPELISELIDWLEGDVETNADQQVPDEGLDKREEIFSQM